MHSATYHFATFKRLSILSPSSPNIAILQSSNGQVPVFFGLFVPCCHIVFCHGFATIIQFYLICCTTFSLISWNWMISSIQCSYRDLYVVHLIFLHIFSKVWSWCGDATCDLSDWRNFFHAFKLYEYSRNFRNSRRFWAWECFCNISVRVFMQLNYCLFSF